MVSFAFVFSWCIFIGHKANRTTWWVSKPPGAMKELKPFRVACIACYWSGPSGAFSLRSCCSLFHLWLPFWEESMHFYILYLHPFVNGMWPFLGQEDPLEEEMVTHSSILAWRIPWTEEPNGLPSMRSQRVRHNWATKHRASSDCLLHEIIVYELGIKKT